MHHRSRLRQLDTTAVHLLQKVREGLKRSQGYAGSRAEEGNDIEVITSKYKNGIPPEVRSEPSHSSSLFYVDFLAILICFIFTRFSHHLIRSTFSLFPYLYPTSYLFTSLTSLALFPSPLPFSLHPPPPHPLTPSTRYPHYPPYPSEIESPAPDSNMDVRRQCDKTEEERLHPVL